MLADIRALLAATDLAANQMALTDVHLLRPIHFGLGTRTIKPRPPADHSHYFSPRHILNNLFPLIWTPVFPLPTSGYHLGVTILPYIISYHIILYSQFMTILHLLKHNHKPFLPLHSL